MHIVSMSDDMHALGDKTHQVLFWKEAQWFLRIYKEVYLMCFGWNF